MLAGAIGRGGCLEFDGVQARSLSALKVDAQREEQRLPTFRLNPVIHSLNDPHAVRLSSLSLVASHSSSSPLTSPQYSPRMDAKPRKSVVQRTLTKLTKPFKSKSREQSQERPIAGQPRDSLGIDQRDRGASAPPDIPQESTGRVRISTPTISVLARSTQSLILGVPAIDHLSDASPGGQTVSTAQINEQSVASFTPAPISLAIGTTETAMLSSLKPSPAIQTSKFIGKGLLGLLSSAAEGIPFPGVKGIFDTVIKIINVIEVGHPNGCWRHGLITLLQATQANQAAFKDLEILLNTLIDTVIAPLKQKELSDIPLTLQTSLANLERYDFYTNLLYVL
jgi:hypothetical protein